MLTSRKWKLTFSIILCHQSTPATDSRIIFIRSPELYSQGYDAKEINDSYSCDFRHVFTHGARRRRARDAFLRAAFSE